VLSRVALVLGLIVLAASSPAQEAASPSASAAPLQARLFVIHKELPLAEKGGRIPALVGKEPIYMPGEKVQFGAFRPGGDDFILESVEVKIGSAYTNSQGFTMPLTETNASSNTYMGTLELNEKLVVQAPTRDRGFATLLADPSPAGPEFARMAVQGYPGMPREDLGQINVGQLDATFPPVRQWLEQGGAEEVNITYGPLSARFLVGRPANWLYLSGRYDPLSGFLSLGGLGPQDVLTTRWRESLQVLVLAANHAADVNDEAERQPYCPMRGQHGPEWWRKFGRTLLGYAGEAPGGDAEAAIARRFLKLASNGPGAADEPAQSRHFVRAWMLANQAQLVAGASAIDAEGRHVAQPRARALTLRGLPFTLPAVDPWTPTPRSEWEAKAAALREESLHVYWSDYLLAELSKQRAGAPPSASEFLNDAGIDWILTASHEQPKDQALRDRVRGVMERRHRYATHVYHTFQGRKIGG
jgi:hypothetical protein